MYLFAFTGLGVEGYLIVVDVDVIGCYMSGLLYDSGYICAAWYISNNTYAVMRICANTT